MRHIRVSAVYSKLSEPKLDIELPNGISLRQHQAETLSAVTNSDAEVVFNTAMTGDGKSLAAYLPALLDGRAILAMYPTNELINDQQRQIENYQELFQTNILQDVMYSDRLYELRADFDLRSQGKAVDQLTWKNSILLTNPDIFNLIANFKYLRETQNPDALLQRVIELYDLFLFDEFHIYSATEVVSVLTSLLYVLEQTGNLPYRKKFIFLSATPSPMLLKCLEEAGVKYQVIEGCYAHEEPLPKGKWQPISAQIDLHFHSVGRKTYEWIEQNYPLIADWFTTHPNSRGAIIVNSVALAKRIVAFLKERQQAEEFPKNLKIGENTGLTGIAEKRFALLESDLLVGTSTVDIGVDFKINFLIFEALDPGTWIQRLGRLGRHKKYTRPDDEEIFFDAYMAHSLLPRYSYERVEKKLADRSELTKSELFELVRGTEEKEGIFSPVNDFRHYQKSWGWLHAAHVINTLGHPRLRENYAATRDKLTQTYTQIYNADIAERVKWYYAINQERGEIIDDAVIKFRGETPFTCGIIDETDGEIKDYNLLWVLSNAEVELISKSEFFREVKKRGATSHKYQYAEVYLRLLNYRAERLRFRLLCNYPIEEKFESKDYRAVQVLYGFQIEVDGVPFINRINRWIRPKKLVCLIRKERADTLRAKLRLPAMFPLYRLIDRDGNEFTVAFSKEALLLQSQPYIFSASSEYFKALR
ncbi:TPA: type I-D CRISPR-associated helicase Cas3' [Candidatus Poribacteria bacterium]|nr:type I-D CRISPR-associated helicase Cas3' [Candidatus Poribacteria bacterium]